MAKDKLSFEEACKELQLSEDELEQLVANGEIAGVKEGDTVTLKGTVEKQEVYIDRKFRYTTLRLKDCSLVK